MYSCLACVVYTSDSATSLVSVFHLDLRARKINKVQPRGIEYGPSEQQSNTVTQLCYHVLNCKVNPVNAIQHFRVIQMDS